MGKIHEMFGRRVRELRKSRGLSQEELGEKANLHYTYIGGVERGERNLSLSCIEKIAKGLGVDIGELFLWGDIQRKASFLKKELINLLKGRSPDEIEKLRKIIKILFE